MDDTRIGGPGGAFPQTRHSIVLATGDPDPQVRERALANLIDSYWKPSYKYVRLKWRVENEEAKDLIQGFFATALQKEYLQRFDPQKARFRTYLRTCLDGYVADYRKAARRLKRGGGATHLSLDFEDAEGELRQLEIPDDVDPDELFRQEWIRHLMAQSLEQLRAQCEAAGHEVQFRLFERYDVEGADAGERLTYSDLAAQFDIPVTQVTNGLHAARRKFREILLEQLWQVCADEQEFRDEARELLG